MTDGVSTPPTDPAATGDKVTARTTREDIVRALARSGISDLETFVKANMDKARESDDDAPGVQPSGDAFIHSHYIFYREVEV